MALGLTIYNYGKCGHSFSVMANAGIVLVLYTLNMYRKYSIRPWHDIFWTDHNDST